MMVRITSGSIVTFPYRNASSARSLTLACRYGSPAAARRMNWSVSGPVAGVDELDDAHVGGEAEHRPARLAVADQPLRRDELVDRRHPERVADGDPVPFGQQLTHRGDHLRRDPQPAGALLAGQQHQCGGVREQRRRLRVIQAPHNLPGRQRRRGRDHPHGVAAGDSGGEAAGMDRRPGSSVQAASCCSARARVSRRSVGSSSKLLPALMRGQLPGIPAQPPDVLLEAAGERLPEARAQGG
jgi:hypothetical protein